MPLYTFICPNCGHEEQRITGTDIHTLPCQCGGEMRRQLPQKISATTYVTKDQRRGVQQKKNLEAQLTKRMRDHHDRYEVEEKVEKHGTDDMQRFGWDKKRKKL